MKKLWVGSLGAVALFAGGSALAADLAPVYKSPPPMVAPVWSWTGCYIGAHAGGGWGRKRWSDFGIEITSHDVSGVLAGGQFGCDYQVAPTWLVGIEGQASWADITGSERFFGVNVFNSKVDFLGSVTGRIGFTPAAQWLIYGKGGVAWVH